VAFLITFIVMALRKIELANYFLITVAAVWALYLGLFFVVKANRGKKQIKTALIAGLASTLVCDIVWFFKFFDNLDYEDPGLLGMAWLFLLPAVMLFMVMLLSYINTSRYEHEQKKRLKEEEKLRKKESRRAKYEHQDEVENK